MVETMTDVLIIGTEIIGILFVLYCYCVTQNYQLGVYTAVAVVILMFLHALDKIIDRLTTIALALSLISKQIKPIVITKEYPYEQE